MMVNSASRLSSALGGIIFFIYINNSCVKGVYCPPESQESVFYSMELFIASDARFCTLVKKAKVSSILTQILGKVLGELPGLVSANSTICDYPQPRQRRRSLLHPSATKEQNTLPTSISFKPRTLTAVRHSTSHSREFVYRGSLRCTFCPWDNADYRQRQLKGGGQKSTSKCRQKWVNLERINFDLLPNNGDAGGWNNVKIFSGQQGRSLLGPYGPREKISKIIHVPPRLSSLRITFRVHQNQMGQEKWQFGDRIIVRVNDTSSISLRYTLDKRTHHRHGPLSGTVRWHFNRFGLRFMDVMLQVNLVAMLPDFLDTGHQIKISLLTDTNGENRTALFGPAFLISGARTCAKLKSGFMDQEIPGGGEEEEESSSSSSSSLLTFEDLMELTLSQQLTREFQAAVQADRHSCFRNDHPEIYVNLYEEETYAEAEPSCGAKSTVIF